MKIVFFHQGMDVPSDLEEAVSAFPKVTLAAAAEPADLEKCLPGAEILVVRNSIYTPENAKLIRDHGRDLRWIQFSTSGIDKAIASGFPSGVVVTNMAGLRAFSVAEHAVSLMLGLVRQVHATEQARARRSWARAEVTPSVGNLAGRRLLIIGLGAIGREIARKAMAFDMPIAGVSRTGTPDEIFQRLYSRKDLVAACAEADIVVIAAAHDAESDRLLSAEAIAAMKPTACVINIARGQLIDEPALVAALQQGRLAGAGLDVAMMEPLPEDHPFWTLPNVLLTPHIGGAGDPGIDSGLGTTFGKNLARWIAKEPLAQIVIAETA
jgi:phosphoglycerate dehydrogenase-like enzyme